MRESSGAEDQNHVKTAPLRFFVEPFQACQGGDTGAVVYTQRGGIAYDVCDRGVSGDNYLNLPGGRERTRGEHHCS